MSIETKNKASDGEGRPINALVSATDRLNGYIERWDELESPKPKNEAEFVEAFIDYLAEIDDPRDIKYDGLNYQAGRQIKIRKDATYDMRFKNPFLEIVYSDKHLKVYAANNNGFWVPEYISVKRGDELYDRLKDNLRAFLVKIFGIEQLH